MRDPSPAIKRQKLDTNQESLVLGESESSAYNARVFRKIQKHLAADPDVDILSLLPTGYSDRLAEKKKRQAPGWTPSELPKKLVSTNNEIETDNDPFGPLLTDTIPAPIIVYPLSESVHSIILAKGGGNTIPPSSKELLQVLENSEIIWQSKGGRGHAIVKCNAEIVVKVVPKGKDHTECTTLQYLEQHAPQFPAPRPLGVLAAGTTSFIFMSLILGTSLDRIWPQLSEQQKCHVSDQLNNLILDLRLVPWSPNMPLGGVNGEGCKDARRSMRKASTPICSSAEFEDFLFSNPSFGGAVYISFLRSLFKSDAACIKFTHGDLRPENIIAKLSEDGVCTITGIIDWETSGFYPEYFESTKVTNTMAPQETSDWYLHLPECVSPAKYPVAWLIDRLWDKHIT